MRIYTVIGLLTLHYPDTISLQDESYKIDVEITITKLNLKISFSNGKCIV